VLAAAQRLRRRVDFSEAVRAGRRAGRGSLVVHLVTPNPAAPNRVAPNQTAPNQVALHLVAPNLVTPGSVATDNGGAEASLEPVRADQSVRAGFVVSKAVGGAVVRNLVRRRLRHLVRDRLGALAPGSTLVVRALPAAAERRYDELAADLDAAIASATRPRVRGPKQRDRSSGGDR
jgi:ribonuclease P protein component